MPESTIKANDYATIQRALGQLEGIASAIGNEDVANQIYDTIEILDAVIDPYMGEE